MKPIEPDLLQAHLETLYGQELYLHLETTQGAYTQGGFSAFARNVKVRFQRAALEGNGPFRAGLQLDNGWIVAEGLTHWELDDHGRMLAAGHDEEGRITVALQLSPTPFPLREAHPADTPKKANTALTPSASADERHLLVVLAHPDDESFGCAGRIALLRRQGIPVTCVSVTSGQMGRNMGRPPFANRETLSSLREQEYRDALNILGVEDIRLLRVWDKTASFVDPETLADQVAEIIAEVQPSTIITFHPELGGHPDHNATGAATIRAVRRLQPDARPRVHCLAVVDDEHEPDLPKEIFDITEVQDLKEAAFQAHRSQTEGWEERMAANPEMAERIKHLMVQEKFWVYPV